MHIEIQLSVGNKNRDYVKQFFFPHTSYIDQYAIKRTFRNKQSYIIYILIILEVIVLQFT